MDWIPDICIYHDPCDDGFAAAWCVWKRWGLIDFRPANYGWKIPDHDIDGKNILVVDFSFPPNIIEQMAERAKSIVILDHHKTAEADLSELHSVHGAQFDNVGRLFGRMTGTWREKVLAEFDMERSGASLAWRFCFPNNTQPELIRHIEDRDLWKFDIPDTKAISLYLRSFDRTFEGWDLIMDDFQNYREKVLSEARAVEMFSNRKVFEIADTATIEQFEGYEGVAVAYAPYTFVSEVGHELLRRHPTAPFAAIIVNAHGGTTYSLRSTNDRVDVSAVAKAKGGGGHRNAAGFQVASRSDATP